MKIYNYILLGCLISSSFACSDILNKKDLSAVTEEDVWNDSKYATAYLDKLCRDNLPDWDAGASNNSDEANGGDGIMYGQLTTSSIDTWNYAQIRKINLLLQKVGSGSIDEETQNTLKAQALVLRAWRYFQMVRLYGGVPLILEPQEVTGVLRKLLLWLLKDVFCCIGQVHSLIQIMINNVGKMLTMPINRSWKN